MTTNLFGYRLLEKQSLPLHFLCNLSLIHWNSIIKLILFHLPFVRLLLQTLRLRPSPHHLFVKHLMQESRHSSIEYILCLQSHRETMPSLFKMLINMRILPQNITHIPTTQSLPTSQANPQPFTLITFLTKRYYRGLLMIPTQRTGIKLPSLQTGGMEIVAAEDRYTLSCYILEADSTL